MQFLNQFVNKINGLTVSQYPPSWQQEQWAQFHQLAETLKEYLRMLLRFQCQAEA